MGTFRPTEEQIMIRDMVRDYAKERLKPQAPLLDRTGSVPFETLKEMAELGLMGMNVSEKYGGTDIGAVAYSMAMTEIAAACASSAVTTSVTNMVAEIICRFGTEEQKRLHVPRITSGEYPAAAFALSEAGAGSDPGAMRTRAVKQGDKYIISGEKMWITSGRFAGVTVLMARTGGPGTRGISAFLLTPDTPGFSIGAKEDKMGLRGSETVTIVLEEAELPLSSLLGQEGGGFGVAMTALDSGRIGIASQATGIGQAALIDAGLYALERQQFNTPIARLDPVKNMIGLMTGELEAARHLTLCAASMKEAGQGRFSREAALAKLYATEAANRICQSAVQIHGGYGYVKDFEVERYYRDVRVTTIYEGTTQVQEIVASRETLNRMGTKAGN